MCSPSFLATSLAEYPTMDNATEMSNPKKLSGLEKVRCIW